MDQWSVRYKRLVVGIWRGDKKGFTRTGPLGSNKLCLSELAQVTEYRVGLDCSGLSFKYS